MNQASRQLAIFTKDLLGHPQDEILLGRRDFEREDFDKRYIVIDQLGAGRREAWNKRYDGTNEVMAYDIHMRLPMTVSFYGPGKGDNEGGFVRAMRFTALTRSQIGREIMNRDGITVYAPSNPTDVKALTGQQHGERYDVEVSMRYVHTVTEDRLRIDIPQVEVQDQDENVKLPEEPQL